MLNIRSIRSKLILIIMLISGISLIFSIGALIIIDAQYIKTTIYKRLTIQAAIIAENSIAALAFQDKDAVQQTLNSLAVDNNIIEASISTVKQQRFAIYQRKETRSFTDTLANLLLRFYNKPNIIIKRPITLINERLGQINIVYDHRELVSQLIKRLTLFGWIFLVTLFIAYLLARKLQASISKPITHLADITRRVTEDGSYLLRAQQFSNDEMGSLTRHFNSMLDHIQRRDDDLEAKVVKRTEELIKLNQKLSFQAYHDKLTRLPNRAMIDERLNQTIDQARLAGYKIAVVLIDLDNFKTINDTEGHLAGDEMLYTIAARLVDVVGSAGIVARLGGDEFILVLDHLQDVKTIKPLLEELLLSIQQPVEIEGKNFSVTISAGISVFPDHGADTITLKRMADLAMYVSKNKGRNTFQFYNPSMSARANYRLKLENTLRSALDEKRFELLYQPQVNVAEQRIIGAEALLRLRHPEKGLLPPASYISAAEDSGLIIKIDEWVLNQACHQAKLWQTRLAYRIKIAVNISVPSFLHGNIISMVENALASSSLDPQLLELEITENSFIEQDSVALTILNSLKKMGISLSIDDFGTGYSSLSYLKRFPVDGLKIDQSFIRDVITDKDDAAIVRAIIVMAQNLKLKVVAEGVETEKQRQFIHKIGCDLMQGYLFSEPMAAKDFIQLLILEQAGQSKALNLFDQ